ncbi:MAG TPA: hypothetical protein VGH01_11330 [Jatrophihabitantaceae bacterium]
MSAPHDPQYPPYEPPPRTAPPPLAQQHPLRAPPPYPPPSYPPAYAPAPYPPPPYPPPYASAPYPPAPYATARPLRRGPFRNRRNGWIAVVIGVATLVAVLVIAGLIGGVSRAPARIVQLPDTVDNYQAMYTPQASTMTDRMRIAMSTTSGTHAFDEARVRVYQDGSTPTPALIVIAINANDNSSANNLLADGSPQQIADSALYGASPVSALQPSHYPPGPFGGVIACAPIELDTTAGTGCVWSDRASLGILIEITGAPSDQLAKTTLDLRTAAEH